MRHVHAELDAEGIAAILLHYAAVNPLSGPFWAAADTGRCSPTGRAEPSAETP